MPRSSWRLILPCYFTAGINSDVVREGLRRLQLLRRITLLFGGFRKPTRVELNDEKCNDTKNRPRDGKKDAHDNSYNRDIERAYENFEQKETKLTKKTAKKSIVVNSSRKTQGIWPPPILPLFAVLFASIEHFRNSFFRSSSLTSFSFCSKLPSITVNGLKTSPGTSFAQTLVRPSVISVPSC